MTPAASRRGNAKGTGFITSTLAAPVTAAEAALRPLSFADFAGQAKTIERLQVMVGAAKKRGDRPQPHPPLGAARPRQDHPRLHPGKRARQKRPRHLRARRREGGRPCRAPHQPRGGGPPLHRRDPQDPEDRRGVPLLGDGGLPDRHHDRPGAERPERAPVAPPVHADRATTRAGLLTAPLRSRFTLQTRLDYYDKATLHSIVRGRAGSSRSRSTRAAPRRSRRARGTPRVANNLINFIRDFAQERAGGAITREVAAAGLELLEIDAAGLDEMDKRMLRAMAENYRGGPWG
jgi:Holliday junction DNA helicase RuvB